MEQKFSWKIICRGRWEVVKLSLSSQFSSILPLRSEIALARLFINSAHTSFVCIRIPAPRSTITQCGCLLCLRTPDKIRFSARLSVSALPLPTCSASRPSWSHPFLLVPSHRQSAPFVPPPGHRVRQSLPLRSVPGYPAGLAGSARDGWRRKWRHRAPRVGRSRGCSRSGAAAS